MPELMVGLIVGLMGLAWWFQTTNVVKEYKTPIRHNPEVSQIVLVSSVEESAPFACRPIEKNEDEPVMRNLTESFEKRRYIVESETQCIPE